MGLEQLDRTQEEGQAADLTSTAAASNAPGEEAELTEQATHGAAGVDEEPEEELLPRDPTLLRPTTHPLQVDWDAVEESTRSSGYKSPPGKRGRKPDPRGARAMRTYLDWKLRATTTTAEDRAAARDFGLDVMEAMRGRGEHSKADDFGRREGFLLEVKPVAAPATPLVSEPTAPAPSGTAPPASGAAPAPPSDAASPKPQGPRVYGQPVARLEGTLQAVSPVVDVLANLGAAWGIDLTQTTRRTFFRGTPHQREVEISPKERLAELIAKKMCERAEEAGLVDGEGEDEDTNLELLMLLSTTVGPVAASVGKRLLETCGRGAVALYNLVRRRR